MAGVDAARMAEAAAQDFPIERPKIWSAEPSQMEVVFIAVFTALIFATVIITTTSFSVLVENFGDSSAYMSIAGAIRKWDFQGVTVKQFWGLPYLMAAISWLTHLSDRTALIGVSLLSSFVAVTLAYRLWGGWIAGFFAVLNFDWLQRSMLGGAEPLFMALLLGSFLAVRRERWWTASLLASLATIVRPLGIFALAGIGVTLLWRREFRHFIRVVGTGLAVGIAYAAPLAYQFGDPLATVHSYQQPGATTPNLFGIPFYAIVKGTLIYSAPWTNLVLTFGWVLFVIAGTIRMAYSPEFRQYGKAHSVEMAFALPYLLSICCYNLPYWARGSFPRFAIPVIPFVLLALAPYWPKDRRVLWALAAISPVLAASSALGIGNVLQRLGV